jgi:TRAP-type C4-dicarboxylate transport system substrate-binding protein
LEIPIPVIHQNKFYEVTDYLSLTSHTYSPLVIMISEKAYNELPEDLQLVVQEAVDEAVVNQRAKNKDNVERLLNDLSDQGMQINEVENINEFKEKMMPLYEEFEDDIGKDLLDKFLN